MNIWVAVLLSSIASSLLGSIVLWILLSVWPGSTAAFSPALYFSMVALTSIVVTITALLVTLSAKSYVERIRTYTALSSCIRTAMGGALLYFSINLFLVVASNNNGIFEKFMLTGGFIFPICVGAIYGAVFGAVIVRFR